MGTPGEGTTNLGQMLQTEELAAAERSTGDYGHLEAAWNERAPVTEQ